MTNVDESFFGEHDILFEEELDKSANEELSPAAKKLEEKLLAEIEKEKKNKNEGKNDYSRF